MDLRSMMDGTVARSPCMISSYIRFRSLLSDGTKKIPSCYRSVPAEDGRVRVRCCITAVDFLKGSGYSRLAGAGGQGAGGGASRGETAHTGPILAVCLHSPAWPGEPALWAPN